MTVSDFLTAAEDYNESFGFKVRISPECFDERDEFHAAISKIEKTENTFDIYFERAGIVRKLEDIAEEVENNSGGVEDGRELRIFFEGKSYSEEPSDEYIESDIYLDSEYQHIILIVEPYEI